VDEDVSVFALFEDVLFIVRLNWCSTADSSFNLMELVALETPLITDITGKHTLAPLARVQHKLIIKSGHLKSIPALPRNR
jgi:hypothetical protein